MALSNFKVYSSIFPTGDINKLSKRISFAPQQSVDIIGFLEKTASNKTVGSPS